MDKTYGTLCPDLHVLAVKLCTSRDTGPMFSRCTQWRLDCYCACICQSFTYIAAQRQELVIGQASTYLHDRVRYRTMLRSRSARDGFLNALYAVRSAASWATVQDPTALSGANVAQAYNLGAFPPKDGDLSNVLQLVDASSPLPAEPC